MDAKRNSFNDLSAACSFLFVVVVVAVNAEAPQKHRVSFRLRIVIEDASSSDLFLKPNLMSLN